MLEKKDSKVISRSLKVISRSFENKKESAEPQAICMPNCIRIEQCTQKICPHFPILTILPHSDTRKFTELLGSFSINQHVDKPTHEGGHTLDVIMSRDADNLIRNVEVGDMITDHCLLLCNVHHPKPHLQKKKILTRKLRSIDLPSFREDIAQGLRDLDDRDSVSDLLDSYDTHLTNVLNKHAPTKEILLS